MNLKDDEDVAITLVAEPGQEIGLATANLIRVEDWDTSYLEQVCTNLEHIFPVSQESLSFPVFFPRIIGFCVYP